MRIQIAAVVSLAVLLSACSAPAPTKSVSRSAPPRVSARDFLYAAQNEGAGYGLYSYVLLANPAAPASMQLDRNRAAVLVFLTSLREKNEFQGQIDPANINLTYLPERAKVIDKSEDVDSHLAVYDYARADVYLRKLQRRHGEGPILVSTLSPLSRPEAVDADKIIFQDLSAIPPKMVRLWIENFLAQAEQEQFWVRRSRQEFILNLRTFIAHGGDETTHMGTALASIVWMGDRGR